MANNRWYLWDYCKRRGLGSPRTIAPGAPYDTDDTAEFAGVTNLGCSLVVGHESGAGDSVLTRFNHQTGAVEQELLVVGNGELIDRPGPSGWVQGVPAPFLTGSIPNPYPAAVIGRNYVVSFDGIPWLVDTGFIGFSSGLPGMLRVGHGGDLGLQRTCVVEGEQEFLVQNKLKALHRHRLYARVGTQDSATDPSSLLYDDADEVYRWPTIYQPFAQRRDTFQFGAFDGVRIRVLRLRVAMWAVHPILAGATAPLTANFLADNGPGQSRGYILSQVEDGTAPDYGGSVGASVNMPGLRAGAYLYGLISKNGPNPATLTVNGAEPTFNPITIPGPQEDDIFGDLQYDQVAVIGPRNVGAWTFEVTGHGFTSFGVPDPLVVGPLTFLEGVVPQGALYEGIIDYLYSDVPV